VTETQTVDLAAWLDAIWKEEERPLLERMAASRAWGKTTARQDLARIAADRKTLARYNEVRTSPLGPDAFANGNAMSRLDELDQVLRLLASPYKGREGWQEAWG